MPSRLFIITFILAAALLGVVLGRDGLPLSGAAGPTAILALLLVASSKRGPRRAWLLLAVILFLFGVHQGEQWRAGMDKLSAMVGSEATIQGRIADDPVSPKPNRTDFRIKDLVVDGTPMVGVVRVRTYRLSSLRRDDQVVLSGTLRDGFGPWQAELFYPRTHQINRTDTILQEWRGRLIAGMRSGVTEPAASFGLGLLVGVRSLLPRELQAQLALVGLSHLVAVSGYNLTILVRASRTLLARISRGVALAGSLWLIIGFVLLTGASASIVRAGVVAVLVLLADHYGRRFEPIPLILLVASATALWNPGNLTDLGWLLSFLAFFGILVLAPLVIARLNVPDRVLPRLLVESLCAHILTLPLIMFIFGQMSLVAPLANILILPLIPLAMLLSFIAAVWGMALPAFAGWLAWPAEWFLRMILAMVDALARIPGAGRNEGVNLFGMLLLYGLVALVTALLVLANRRQGRSVQAKPLLELGSHEAKGA